LWIAIERAVPHVADDADDLPGGLFELRTQAFADVEAIGQRVAFGPIPEV
jgi:hypothetical protein